MSTKSFDTYTAVRREGESDEQREQREALTESFRIGTDILKLRMERGLTQVQLAERSGVPQSEISRIERGLGNPTEDTLARLAGALQAHIAVIPDEAEITVPQLAPAPA